MTTDNDWLQYGDAGPHEHDYEEKTSYARWTGEPIKRCKVEGCRTVSIDFDDDFDDDEWEEVFLSPPYVCSNCGDTPTEAHPLEDGLCIHCTDFDHFIVDCPICISYGYDIDLGLVDDE